VPLRYQGEMSSQGVCQNPRREVSNLEKFFTQSM